MVFIVIFGSVGDRDDKFSKWQVWKLYKYSGLHTECIFAHVIEEFTIFQQLYPRWWWASAKLAHVSGIMTLFRAQNAWRHVIRVTPKILMRRWICVSDYFLHLPDLSHPFQFRRNLDSWNFADRCNIPQLTSWILWRWIFNLLEAFDWANSL